MQKPKSSAPKKVSIVLISCLLALLCGSSIAFAAGATNSSVAQGTIAGRTYSWYSKIECTTTQAKGNSYVYCAAGIPSSYSGIANRVYESNGALRKGLNPQYNSWNVSGYWSPASAVYTGVKGRAYYSQGGVEIWQGTSYRIGTTPRTGNINIG